MTKPKTVQDDIVITFDEFDEPLDPAELAEIARTIDKFPTANAGAALALLSAHKLQTVARLVSHFNPEETR